MQSVYFLPVESQVTEGEELSLTVCHDDYSLWYSLQSHRYKSTETTTCACVETLYDSKTYFFYFLKLQINHIL